MIRQEGMHWETLNEEDIALIYEVGSLGDLYIVRLGVLFMFV